MMTLVDFPAPVGLLSNAAGLKMPFSDAIKYSILGLSVALLLVALGILAWQAFRCCTQTHTANTQQDTVNSELLYSDGKSTTAGNYSGAPSTKVEDVGRKVHMLSRCLSQASYSLESRQAIGDTGEQANVGKVEGSLRFSVYYDQLQSRLVVTVLEVEGLLDQSQTHSLQRFVKIRLMWAGGTVESGSDEEGERTGSVLWTVLHEWQTRIVKGSCNPLFGDQFSCVLCGDKELHDITLRMEVRDFDKFSRHTVLGEVRVPLGQLNILYPLELQKDLQTPQKDLVGEVLLSLKFLPTSQRLEVGLLKVRTALPEISSDAAMYGRISVQCNQCKLRYQKTSAVARCMVTVFNEVLMFSLPGLPLEQCKEKSLEDEHWDLMMRSVRQPIAKWHGLLI